jgi:hypothetical protein
VGSGMWPREPACLSGKGRLLGALLLDGLLTVALAATRWYWAALVLWAAISVRAADGQQLVP